MDKIRNIAIIAHVDHGKTTLVDQLLRQSGTFRSNQKVEERMMDSMDLEREKGITIRAKNAAFQWNGYRVNIVDTPGHADFGGEVERIMKMVDGVLLVVDAHDGPQAQTRFVLRKALENRVKPIVVINKIDRENARPHKVLDMIFDLFVELKANDEQLDFPIVYASAKNGFAMREIHENSEDMTPLFETIIKHVPPPTISSEPYLQMLVSNLDYSDYLGRIALGRIVSGRVAVGDSIVCIHREGRRERANVTALFTFSGMGQVETKHASRGRDRRPDRLRRSLYRRNADRPRRADAATVRRHRSADDPDAHLRQRFTLRGPRRKVRHRAPRPRAPDPRNARQCFVPGQRHRSPPAAFEVNARGEMQIAILVEQMRREGYEVMVSRPEVIFQRDEDGGLLEPIEKLYVEVPKKTSATCCKRWPRAKGEVVGMDHHATRVSVEAIIPTRGLIGFESDLVNLTRGEGIMSHLFREYAPLQRRARRQKSRRDGFDGSRRQHGLCAEQHSGTRQTFHRPAGRDLCGHDRRRKRAPGRSAGQSLQGEKSHQHAQPGRRQGHPARGAARR